MSGCGGISSGTCTKCTTVCPSGQQVAGCGGTSSGTCSQYVIMLSIRLPSTSTAFNNALQQAYKEQLSLAAGLTKSDFSKVYFENVVDHVEGQLRALSESINFDVKIVMTSTSSALKAATLLTQNNINKFFTAQGLPSAIITSPASFVPPAVILLEMTPAPSQTVGGLSMTNIIAIASSVGGAIGLTVLACCLKRLNQCGLLPNTMKKLLPKRLYISSDELDAISEQRLSERISGLISNPNIHSAGLKEESSTSFAEGYPTAPPVQVGGKHDIGSRPTYAHMFNDRPAAFAPNAQYQSSTGVSSELVYRT